MIEKYNNKLDLVKQYNNIIQEIVDEFCERYYKEIFEEEYD